MIPGKLSQRLLTCKNPLHSFLWSPDHKHWTDRQVINSSLNKTTTNILKILKSLKSCTPFDEEIYPSVGLWWLSWIWSKHSVQKYDYIRSDKKWPSIFNTHRQVSLNCYLKLADHYLTYFGGKNSPRSWVHIVFVDEWCCNFCVLKWWKKSEILSQIFKPINIPANNYPRAPGNEEISYTLIFIYKKLAIRNQGLRWKKNKNLQDWARTDIKKSKSWKSIFSILWY